MQIFEIEIILIFFNKFQSLQALLKTTIKEFNGKCYSRLSDILLASKTSPKLYWSILNTFLNNKTIPCIPHPFCTMANSSWTFRKRLNSLMTSFQSSILLLTTTVNFPRFSLKKRASHFRQLSFWHMIS